MQKEIIEIAGLPGAGKTAWAKSQPYPSLGNFSRTRRYWGTFLFKLRHPFLFSLLLWITISNTRGIRLLKHKVFFILFWALAAEHYTQRKKGGRIIIDEGIFQHLFSVFEYSMSETDAKTITRIIRALPPRTVLWFTCDKKERETRMQKRKRVPLSGFGKAYQEKWLGALEDNETRFISLIEKSQHELRRKATD